MISDGIGPIQRRFNGLHAIVSVELLKVCLRGILTCSLEEIEGFYVLVP